MVQGTSKFVIGVLFCKELLTPHYILLIVNHLSLVKNGQKMVTDTKFDK